MEKDILVFIIIAGSIVFILSLCKNKREVILNFLLRSMMSFLGIYILNRLAEYMGSTVTVGINAMTIGTAGVLGLPGFALLYAISYLFVKTS